MKVKFEDVVPIEDMCEMMKKALAKRKAQREKEKTPYEEAQNKLTMTS